MARVRKENEKNVAIHSALLGHFTHTDGAAVSSPRRDRVRYLLIFRSL